MEKSNTADDYLIKKIEDIDDRMCDENRDVYNKIEDAKQIYVLSKELSEVNEPTQKYCKERSIKTLLNYGLYLKEGWQKSETGEMFRDYNFAKWVFNTALQYEKNLPLAHYRLGHIYFRKEEYLKASDSFVKALEKQDNSSSAEYALLDEQQIKNAKKILSYSGLILFKTYEEDSLSNNDYDDLNKLIGEYIQNKDYSQRNISKRIVGENGSKYITYEEYEDEIERESCVILDGYNDIKKLYCRESNGKDFNGEVDLTINQYRFLCDVILCKKNYYEDKLDSNPPLNDPTAAFRQAVSRLNQKFQERGIPEKLFSIENCGGCRAQYITDLQIYILRRIEED